jgi:HlyD family secretion protein
MTPSELAVAVRSGGGGWRSLLRPALAVGAALLLLAGGLWWRHVREVARRTAPYVTEPIRRGDIRLVVTATGILEPTTRVTVGSELSGTTLEVYSDLNDRVVRGQPLAKLDTAKLAQQTEIGRASVLSARARVVQAAATVSEAAAALARERQLSATGISSPSMLDAAVAASARAEAEALGAEAQVGEAEAQVGEAEAQVRVNEGDLARAVIRSPIDGIVLSRSIEPGQVVAASFTAPQLFVIAERLERMRLEVAVAEADIARVARGQSSSFTVDAWPERSFSARLSRVSYGSEMRDNVVTYLAELEVANDDLSLRPGMTATAEIRVAESLGVLLVPASALRFNPAPVSAGTNPVAKRSFVQSLIPMPTRNRSRPAAEDPAAVSASPRIWVLRENEPAAVEVEAGLSDGRFTEVSAPGLAEGMEVILRANGGSP